MGAPAPRLQWDRKHPLDRLGTGKTAEYRPLAVFGSFVIITKMTGSGGKYGGGYARWTPSVLAAQWRAGTDGPPTTAFSEVYAGSFVGAVHTCTQPAASVREGSAPA